MFAIVAYYIKTYCYSKCPLKRAQNAIEKNVNMKRLQNADLVKNIWNLALNNSI